MGMTANLFGVGADVRAALNQVLSVTRITMTPEQHGAVADFTGNPLTATDNAAAIARAIAAAGAASARLVFGGRYFCSGLPDLQNLDIDWDAAGDAGLVFPSGAHGVVINQDDYNHITRIRNLMILTLGKESGDGLSISYSAADSLTDRHLPRCWLEDVVVRGHDFLSHGWAKGIRLKDVHAPKVIRPQVTGRRDTTLTGMPSFGNMKSGIEFTSTTGLVSIPSDILIDGADIANAQAAISISGDVEGPTVRGSKMVGVWRGIDDQQATKRPGGQYVDNHVNFFDFGIYSYQRPQVQVDGNLFYKIEHSTAASTSVKLDYCDLAMVGTNVHINSASDWGIAGNFIGVEISNSVANNVGAQTMARGTTGVRITGGSQGTRISTPIMSSAVYANGPTPIAVEDQTANLNFVAGRVAEGTNAAAVTVASSLTTIKTISLPAVCKGERYLVTVAVEIAKGATAGDVAAVMYKTAGTATLVFGMSGTQVKDSFPTLPAGKSVVLDASSEITITASGSLDLTLSALSAGSDATVAAASAQITVRRL